jgi:hypothetical protein
VATLLEDRLRSLGDRVPLPGPEVTDRVVAEVRDSVRPSFIDAERGRRRPKARLTRGRLALVAAIGIVGGGAMVIGPLSGGGGHVDPAAAAALHRAAITAAHQPALPPLTPGRYYHFQDTEMGWVERTTVPRSFTSCASACPPPPSDWVVKVRVVTEYWIAANGSGLRTERIGRPTFRSDAVRRTYRRMYGFPVSHPLGLPTNERLPKGRGLFGWGLTYRQLQRLPANPEKLREIVHQQAAPSSQAVDPSSSNSLSYEEFTVVGDMMRASPLRPRVRAAFYTILSQIPGIQFAGPVTDPLGRPGIEVSIQHSSTAPPDILIFDPHSAQLLSEGGGGYSGWSVVNSIGR